MRTVTTLSVVSLLFAAGSLHAQQYVFEENFESPTWAEDVGDPGEDALWTREGVTHPNIQLVQFDDGDCRLDGASNGSKGGGFTHTRDGVSAGAVDPCEQSPGDGVINQGDNEESYLDFHMTVPPGEYFFEVELDRAIYWAESAYPPWNQSWSQGMLFYLGNSQDMAYGTQIANNPPTGPWQGRSWTAGTHQQNNVRISPPIWNSGYDEDAQEGYCGLPGSPGECGVCNTGAFPTPYTNGTDPVCSSREVGVWVSHAWSKYRDGNDVLTVGPDGKAIFRFTLRNKRNDSARTAHAISNLKITLTSTLQCPEPFADVNEDGFVDHEDFAALQRCFTGADDPGGNFDEENCACFDRDRDGDVDQADFQAFLDCYSGPAVPVDPDCGD